MSGPTNGPVNGPVNGAAPFEIFLAAPPGLEAVLCEEARLKGFRRPAVVPGGVTLMGGWSDVWRANLWLRGTGRVLARLASFRAVHLAQLEARAREVPWAAALRPDMPFRVEASCSGSRLYHSGAVAERVARAIGETLGAPSDPENGLTVMVRMERDLCTISLDTSGEALHRRGYKAEVNRAPMRETMAALFLRRCGFGGEEPVLDPMCGSGTLVIEAAEIAARLNPGRARAFAFERLATFDPDAWNALRHERARREPGARFHGSDRDAGAVAMSRANAERAGVSAFTVFRQCGVSEIVPPEGRPGLLITNPPYGARLGDKRALAPLYRAFGHVARERFAGWRVGIVTTEPELARATGLDFLPADPPVPHGGLRVTLYRTEPLA
ncbi:THUMP domain-containing class I SAM-dependent RNA methyltransferase [Acidomonas methanolica]|uniref:THUMP domain-containing class I SAM-dependent RNA methyltransferase n=1 Tax=Acidomonas methanolica TaxID=437 RepID=UPI002119EF83